MDFKWTVARLALTLLTELASSGPAGAAWAAKIGADASNVIARSPVLQRVLRYSPTCPSGCALGYDFDSAASFILDSIAEQHSP